MDRNDVAEQKFRPLKKQMQQTCTRIKQAVRRGTLPERRDVEEFGRQIETMVSYPGFGDAAYPAIVAASRALAESSARQNLDDTKASLAQVLDLQQRCHGGREERRK